MTPKSINLLKKTGRLLVIGGGVMFTLPLYAQRSMTMDFETRIVFYILGSIAVAIGTLLFYRSRQYVAKNLSEKVVDEKDPYVLYLRPFKSDSSFNTVSRSAQITTVAQNLQSTMEEDLFKVMEPFGNMIAIGRPGENLPTPGAAKIYAHDNWKETVLDKMKGAQLVIIYAGDGEGLNWELKQAFETINLKKLLIFIPDMSKKLYELFRTSALEKLGISIPERFELKNGKGEKIYTGFLRFEKNRTPVFLPLYAPVFRTNPYSPYEAKITYALKPLFEDFGLQWNLPPIKKGYMYALIFFGGIVLLILVLIILSTLGVID